MSSFIEEIAGGKLPSVNKKSILVVGGLGVAGVVLFQVLTRNQSSPVENSSPVVIADKGMPTNSADVQAQLQNFAGMTEDYVNQAITKSMNELLQENTQDRNELNSELGKALTDFTNENQKYQQDLQNTLTKELQDLQKDYQDLENQFTNLENSSTPAPVYQATQPVYQAPVQTVNPAFTVGVGTTDKQSIGAIGIKTGNQQVINSEIERAQSVLLYRRQNGLDTSMQEQYLSNLTKAKK